ncbi:hypothetical protein QR98_0102810 [Sarcoptes scabiei]|uniref:Uncharacterized protein n=1 Tax=Sarcoptes scabiei TaxID=52283 RepID=A0A132AL10_SARSC|nr:hypothetical protein QR98_0102810 [Sarcoptes scabiei]
MNERAKCSAILVGDEIGQLKRIEWQTKQSSVISLIDDGPLHPSKSIVSINQLRDSISDQYFLVARKDHEIFVYNSANGEVWPIKYINKNKSHLVGARCVDDQNIVIGFQDGLIQRINVENDLCYARYKPNSKAVNMLGINNSDNFTPSNESPRKRRRIEKNNLTKNSRTANEISNERQNIMTLQNPNWNVSNTYLTCFEVSGTKLAIGGFNCDLKVFDLHNGQSIFNAKSNNVDWLGIRHNIWLSGLEWIDSDSADPHLIATCSRSQPFVLIYDIKQNYRKPAMTINLKSLNEESKVLSFTKLCSLSSLSHYGQSSSSMIVGTTLGRMIAIDLRFKGSTSKILGSFKGFNGGSIRDIKYVQESQLAHKIFSCSMDRFVRIHTMTKTTRTLNTKIYVKTRPTCFSF